MYLKLKLAVPLLRLESYAELLCYLANLLVGVEGFEPPNLKELDLQSSATHRRCRTPILNPHV